MLPVPRNQRLRSRSPGRSIKPKRGPRCGLSRPAPAPAKSSGSSPPRPKIVSALPRFSNSIACAGKSNCCSNVSSRGLPSTACRRGRGQQPDPGGSAAFYGRPGTKAPRPRGVAFPLGIRNPTNPIARGGYSAWLSGRFAVPSSAAARRRCSHHPTHARGSKSARRKSVMALVQPIARRLF
jgi:hypothetical protein